MDETDYKYAVRNPQSRQEFLDEIDMEMYTPFVKEVKYVEESIDGEMMGTACMMAPFPFKIPPKIVVPGETFHTLSWNEFYNVLVHHEGFHTKQWNDRPVGIMRGLFYKATNKFGKGRSYELWDCRGEIEAYVNQIQHPSFDRCNLQFRQEAMSRIIYYQNKIEALGGKF